MSPRLLPILCATSLAACAVQNNDTAASPPRPTALPPSVTERQVDQAFATAEILAPTPDTSAFDLPFGSAAYTGKIGADLNGDSVGSLVGDLNLEVDFRRNNIDGTIDNLNLIDQNGVPDQRFGGQLQISGFENNGDLDAGASGRITAVDRNRERIAADLNLDLEGTVRDDLDRADAVYGTVTGDARGDFNLDVDGVFYGTRD